MKKSLSIRVTGQVQHIGFRYFSIIEAQKENITGFVRNETDGSVVIEAEGEEEALDRFLIKIRQGPAWSRVDRMTVQEQPLQHFKDFNVRY